MEQLLDQLASESVAGTTNRTRHSLRAWFRLASIEADSVTLLDGAAYCGEWRGDCHGGKTQYPPGAGVRCSLSAGDRGGVEQLRTSTPGISAVGECCEINGQTWGLVAPCLKQAEVLAARLAGFTGAGFGWQSSGTRLKVTGIDLFSAGVTDATATDATLSTYNPLSGHYRRLLTRDENSMACC